MTSTPNLLYTDIEDSLRDSVRDLLADRCPLDAVIAVYDGVPVDPALWRTLSGEVGVAALLVPESLGGAGASAREAAVVLEEFGRAVAPVPFLTSSVLATVCLGEAGDTKWLPRLAEGTVTAALALPWTTTPGRYTPSVRAGGDGLLHGRATSVADAQHADVLVVPVAGSEGLGLHGVDARAAGVSVAGRTSLDMTRPIADITFAEVSSERIAAGPEAAAAVDAALVAGAALLASEQVGVAQWCLDTTIAYVRDRRQFGRAVGSFQAVKHRIADLWLEVTSARAAARYAAATLATGSDDRAVAASLAQAYCSATAVRAAEECVQLHGGIGMTWEHPAHLYLKRAKSSEIALGTPGRHRSRLAELVDLPPVALT